MKKCPHGVYIPDFDPVARYCTLCTPPLSDRTLLLSTSSVKQGYVESAQLDVVSFIRQPMGFRLTQWSR